MNQIFANPMSRSPAIALVALHAGYSHSSLALRSITAFCREQPFYPGIRLFEALANQNHQRLLEDLVELRPSLIGFSTYLWNIRESLRLVRILRQLLPDTRLLLGGPEAGPRGEELLKTCPSLDFVIDGEGEAPFCDLLCHLLYQRGSLRDISGLVWRHNEKIQRNPQQLIPVEALQSPVTAGLMDDDKPLVYWETSRGCPFRCTFCSSARDRLRAFPMERVEADLQRLEKLEKRVIKLLDRSFHLGRERTLNLLRRFIATPSSLRFHLELNPDRISEEAMQLFLSAPPGKFQFEIGLQTLHEPVLDLIERKMEVPRALQNIGQLVEMARHPVHVDLIVGLPGEDRARCRESLNRTFLLHAEHLQLGMLKLLPGTPLREQATTLGYRWDPEPPYEVLSHPQLGFDEISCFKRYAELLERIWNSGYLTNTLAWLVDRHYQGNLCDCFDDLLDTMGDGVARHNLQPDALYEIVCRFLQQPLQRDGVLKTLLLWDYSQFSLVTGRTPAWISSQLNRQTSLRVQGTRRRLQVIELTGEALQRVNQRRLDPLQAGHYAVWPRQHKKGTPVEIIALDGPEAQGQTL
jgi:anaerobic magnesium-protoporphyrin IX monomethyl ester cyclase